LLGQHVFYQGVATEVLNPKTALFFLAFIPQFVTASGPVIPQFMVLGCLSVGLNTLVDVGVIALAGPLGQWLAHQAQFPATAAAGLRLDVDWVGDLCGDRSNSRIGLVLSAELFPIAPDTELVSVWPRQSPAICGCRSVDSWGAAAGWMLPNRPKFVKDS
jgi:hypothetical protein